MTVSINISEELYEQAKMISQSHGVSLDEVFASAFAEHFAAWERLRNRATRGDREKFLTVLNKVPDVKPEQFDQI